MQHVVVHSNPVSALIWSSFQSDSAPLLFLAIVFTGLFAILAAAMFDRLLRRCARHVIIGPAYRRNQGRIILTFFIVVWVLLLYILQAL